MWKGASAKYRLKGGNFFFFFFVVLPVLSPNYNHSDSMLYSNQTWLCQSTINTFHRQWILTVATNGMTAKLRNLKYHVGQESRQRSATFFNKEKSCGRGRKSYFSTIWCCVPFQKTPVLQDAASKGVAFRGRWACMLNLQVPIHSLT